MFNNYIQATLLLFMVSEHAFLIVVIFGVMAMVNNGEPFSMLTIMLITFIVPLVMVMSFYMSGDLNRVLNRSKDIDNDNGSNNKDTNL